MAATSSQTSHIAKYDGRNYSLWKLGLWVLLEEHNLIDIVTGEDTLPDEEMDDDGDIENEEEIKEWKVKDC
ncbi:hypothetical protein DAPPUDRAFT_333648 [Daphnia pulex]|uniref:DUF4219 domain-containing protein n=1 Tax=Daphnia pulex TaxID=6669 RepID=E9HTG1_DAPPU|nr:hypothetical protein DAPPUDRAFT_333648 [Daphnia pulex]|eukprot:EFX64968.1 hypothetical protein DAPPUDRAFT_333648 [Daphnia pulex]